LVERLCVRTDIEVFCENLEPIFRA
jgi:hypothetical protein